MKKSTAPIPITVIALLFSLIFLSGISAQENDTEAVGEIDEIETLDDMFADPFSDSDSEEGGETLSDDMLLDPFADESGEEGGGADMEIDMFTDTDEAGGGGGTTDSNGDDTVISDLDFDSMFGEDMVEELDTESQDAAPQDDLLKQEEGLKWGGRISGSLGAEWNWDTVATSDYDFLSPQGEDLVPELEANLFFDARPATDFRVYGKFKLKISEEGESGVTGLETAGIGQEEESEYPEGYSLSSLQTGDSGTDEEDTDEESEEEEEPQTGTPPALELNVFELFSDFTLKDRLFFRFGKHTIKWGTGYFWSPADVLNLTSINAEDPTADREGPISLKTHFPFSYHNAYLYLITNLGTKPIEIAIAPKAEFVIGNSELGLGAYYQHALAPRLITTLATSISDFDIFSEGVMQFGSDKVFVRASRDQTAAEDDEEDDFDVVLETYEAETLLFFHFTIGTRYQKSFSEERGSISILGQYWYNGEGYENSNLLGPAYYLFVNPNTNGLMIQDEEDQPEGYKAPPSLTSADLSNFGRHYGAINISWNIFKTDLTFSLLTLANFNDLSGLFVPSLSYKLFDYCTIAVDARFSFGDPGDEYTNQQALLPGSDEKLGSTITIGVSASLGSGQF